MVKMSGPGAAGRCMHDSRYMLPFFPPRGKGPTAMVEEMTLSVDSILW
jgi:hypothetical protein